jgi:LPS export ABC transporter protein LptC
MLIFACDSGEQDTRVTKTVTRELPNQEGWNSKIFISQAGKTRAVVYFGHMVHYERRKIYYFDQGVSIDFFDEEENHTSRLTSEKGEYHEQSEDVFGIGNVVVRSDSGVSLHTEALRWDNRMEKIVSDTTVMVTTGEGDTLYGKGFESDPDLNRRVIRHPWGVSERRIEVEKLDESFRKKESPVSPDSTAAVEDSTEKRVQCP